MKRKYLRKDVAVISYFELGEQWQTAARENLGDLAEDQRYLEPEEDHTPEKHVLWDLSEAMPTTHGAVLPCSNACALHLESGDNFETVNTFIYED